MPKCFGDYTVIFKTSDSLFSFAWEKMSLIGYNYRRQDLSKPETPEPVQGWSKNSIFRHSFVHAYSFICSLNKHLLNARIPKKKEGHTRSALLSCKRSWTLSPY